MNVSKPLGLGLIWAVGIITIIASSFQDEETVTPPVPVTVSYLLSSLTTPLARELETRSAELTVLSLSGSYNANQGDRLTLERNSIELDTNSGFVATVTPKTMDELLDGQTAFEVTVALDVGLGHNPVAGQFSSLFSGTTTLVTVTASGVDVAVGAAAPESFGWSTFVAIEDDTNATLDMRMASAAYNMIEVVLRATQLAEDIVADIEANKASLEGMNIGTTLALTCDNTTDEGDGQSRLLWTIDAAGTGQGVIGDNDAFEARYGDCRDATRSRYLDGEVLLDSYDPADIAELSIFAVNVDLRSLFVSETLTDIDTTPSASSPRFNGQLALSYTEQAIP
ncbi:MAG: hypothetical protein OER80_01440 [Gammaproteobacteria bacterium]|nr:hypothetical protein [Gammaproteobacteria bacterium]MDH3768971.1 hypothetical protein [Gammaproteobacteria bacterium]